MISGQSGCAGSTPPITSCGAVSLLTNVTRWPTAIVISSGVMPAAVIVIVGGPAGAGGRSRWRVTGGVGAVGVGGRRAARTRGHRDQREKNEESQHGITCPERARLRNAEACKSKRTGWLQTGSSRTVYRS